MLAGRIKDIRKEEGLKSEYLFTKNGLTLQRIDRAFCSALRRAGIDDFRFYNLRHTFASHLVMRCASLKEVQEILGHKSMTMTLRYAHLSQESKKRAVNLLNELTPYVKNDMSQNCHK